MRYALSGLGAAQTNTPEVRAMTVSPGWTQPWLDAALTVQGVSPTQAPRLPDSVAAALRRTGAEVDRVVWGTDSISGKVYARWKPDVGRNAVDYANDMVRVFQSAADEYPSGTRLVMQRYRVAGLLSDSYVYPQTGGASPGAAQGTISTDLPPGIERAAAAEAGQAFPVVPVAIAGGAVIVLGGGFLIWRSTRRPRRNRRRRKS